MRIISGSHKGRHIPIRKNLTARPTTDFAKENLFNIISNQINIEGLDVLDLFAGTGSISFEFASRGCSSIITVEKDYKSYSFIKKTAVELGFDMLRAVKVDAFKFIEINKQKYDLIFADPPYDNKDLKKLPDLLFNSGALKNDGWFILEHGKTHEFTSNEHLFDTRKYGSVHFSFFRKK